jgi:glycogen debranching enzyme
MTGTAEGWQVDLPLAEAGYFRAKAYLIDGRGWQHWPEGPDVGISVHPDRCRTANILYCAFARMFGPTKSALTTTDEKLARTLEPLDQTGYTVIPPSGKLRDLTRQLPHIIDTLGCRILHLLPVNPTPTTSARFGRFGSPYAALDLAAVDPALVEFDKRTTGIDQFRELTYGAHLRGARVFLDMVINHTGWGSVLQENRPEWFLRQADGTFASPGAWGVTWGDLVELKHENVALWDELAEIFLVWCRRGVDGFRCDAGYKVPVPAWQYIVARARQEYPETIFLLEGLGGAWEATAALLTEGGMQWAYSELFQNYSATQVASYLDHSLAESQRVGLLVHYSETHDNERLAARGRTWSLLRNRLCALASVSGGFGFTCGVEWLATEKVRVHGSAGMAWGNPDNLLPELACLDQLVANHPCFFDGAKLTRLSPSDSPVYALLRESQEGKDVVLVLVNTEVERTNTVTVRSSQFTAYEWLAQRPEKEVQSPESEIRNPKSEIRDKSEDRCPMSEVRNKSEIRNPKLETNPKRFSDWVDLLGQRAPGSKRGAEGDVVFTLGPGAAYCLAPSGVPFGLHGDEYRRVRAQAAWGLAAMNHVRPPEKVGQFDWRKLAAAVNRSPAGFLASLAEERSEDSEIRNPKFEIRNKSEARGPKSEAVSQTPSVRREPSDIRAKTSEKTIPSSDLGLRTSDFRLSSPWYPCVISWDLLDRQRITLVPPGHWLLVEDAAPFRASLAFADGSPVQNVESIPAGNGHFACFTPRQTAAEAALLLERYAEAEQRVQAAVRFLPPLLESPGPWRTSDRGLRASNLVLLTNGRGGMARLCVDLGRILSKYDCVLGANLHPSLPVDRHIFAKRIRVWVNADGFISPLDFQSLGSFREGPPAVWDFVAQAGDGRTVEIQMTAAMLEGRNTTVFRFTRPTAALATGKQLPAEADVRLTARLDIEDRNFHWETKRNGGADYHFSNHVRELAGQPGFAFAPAFDRQLRVYADSGRYHTQPEWSQNIPHPVEQSRGQEGSGDAFSPGWFELPLGKGEAVTLVVTADPAAPSQAELAAAWSGYSRTGAQTPSSARSEPPGKKLADEGVLAPAHAIVEPAPDFFDQLVRATRAFVVRRGEGKTVIAGYPWFLDWGRDSFIAARGLLAAGLVEEVSKLLVTFARFEKDGTLPNTIFGEDASNRDTSDAPLWFGMVCEELSERVGPLSRIASVLPAALESIARNYARGTPNGIRMDPASGLIWSPSHFTWMDTNYPACTPREGYPVEIQALWIRLLRQLARMGAPPQAKSWEELAARALASLERLFWREDRGYYADTLLAKPGQPAAEATADDALRSNCLFVVSLGLAPTERAKRCVEAARRRLVVPGALRSLAPLPVSVPLPLYGRDGSLLNDPHRPYWGHYEGDEDTRRKPAYHNGTAWTWTFPTFCEALARAWDCSPEALAAARAYLGSMARLMNEGCLGHIPEILDGDAPHTPRGCDAQAWGVTEALRVWRLLEAKNGL